MLTQILYSYFHSLSIHDADLFVKAQPRDFFFGEAAQKFSAKRTAVRFFSF